MEIAGIDRVVGLVEVDKLLGLGEIWDVWVGGGVVYLRKKV